MIEKSQRFWKSLRFKNKMNLKISLEALKVFENAEFRNLITGRFFIILAFKMTSTLLGWWVYDLTRNPFSIGLIGLSEVVPAVGCALYAGHFIDMNEKRRLLLTCNFAYIILLRELLGLFLVLLFLQ